VLGDISPETELLLCCARVRMDALRTARIRALCEQPLDWVGLVEVARRHGLDPLLHWHLSSLCPDQLPEEVASRLRERFTTNSVRNRFLAVELRRVLALFADAGIPAITYKGPTLALAAYGNLALRRFADLDLLLKKQDVLRAKALLVEKSYRPRFDFTTSEESAFLESQYELILDRDRGRISVELHWEVMPKEFAFRLDQERLWQSAERVSLEGATVLTPAPEDLLLILCAHGTKHLWERLGWVVDVAELVGARRGLRWAAVLEGACRARSERMLLLGLSLAHDLLGAALPEDIRGRVRRDASVRALAARVWRWQLGREAIHPGLVESQVFYLKARERLADRLRYVVRRFAVPTIEDWRWRRLPGWLFALYYVLRPIRLARKHGPRRWTRE
jgi:hypothetical protein